MTHFTYTTFTLQEQLKILTKKKEYREENNAENDEINVIKAWLASFPSLK